MTTGVDLSQFYSMFFDEADELLNDMEQLLLGLDTEQPSTDDLNGIFRAAHSIKGGAGTFGCFEHLTDTTHLLENVLDSLRKGELHLRRDMIDIFLEAKDVLTEQLAAYRQGDEPDQQSYDRICQQLRQLALETTSDSSSLHGVPGGSPEGADTPDRSDDSLQPAVMDGADPVSATSDDPGPSATGTSTGTQVLRVRLTDLSPSDAAALESEMAIMGSIQKKEARDNTLTLWVDTTASANDIDAVCRFIVHADQLDVQACSPSESGQHDQPSGTDPKMPKSATTETDTTAAEPSPESSAADACATPSTAASPPRKKSTKSSGTAVSSTLRVGVEKVDQIINLVGELVITQAMLV